MRRKLGVYSLVALLSFAAFSIFFQHPTIAKATLGIFATPTPTPTTTPTPTPTPTNTPTPTPTPTPTNTPTPTPTPTEMPAPVDLEALFEKYSSQYSVDRGLLKRIADCESHFNTNANWRDVYIGMYQFSESSWVATRTQMNADTNPALRTNAEESIKTAAFKLSIGGQNAWPNCQ
jgi:hypothetical protein